VQIVVEMFGIARHRAGVPRVDVDAATVGDALHQLVAQYPAVAEACFDQGQLRPEYTLNLNGEQFVSDMKLSLRSGDCLLLLSADAGG